MFGTHLPTLPASRSKGHPGRLSIGLRPGLTLIEILMVLGLLLALGAVVFPAMTSRYRNVVFTSSAQRIATYCAEVRAEALRSGRPLIVNWDASQRRLFVEPMVGESDDAARPSSDVNESSIDQSEFSFEQDFEPSADSDARLDRLTLRLEVGFQIVVGNEMSADDPIAEESVFGIDDAAVPADSDDPAGGGWVTQDTGVPLVLMLQDGTAVSLASSFGLRDAAGRTARYEVNTWSGGISWHEVVTSTEEDEAYSQARQGLPDRSEDQ
ncbi:MAG: hypothetical protein HND57_08785 [Planctomycetes bacterium]|nr:hypothetical protein [Planctomycetota bacterium]